MMGIPTLEECEIQPGSFATEPSIGGTYLIVTDRGRKKAIADFDCEDDCQLVAHRCNTFDQLVSACEEGLRLGEIGVRSGLQFDMDLADKFARANPDLAKIRSVIAKAKGATP
jgi:hypothetical protein